MILVGADGTFGGIDLVVVGFDKVYSGITFENGTFQGCRGFVV
jgi:hypothetical protein